MDDNLTQIILAAFALATVIATGVISILSLRMSQKAVTTSLPLSGHVLSHSPWHQRPAGILS